MSEVTIVGAGPYGLSLAAHLNKKFRIFGRPMASWQENMPQGMHLKSEGFASSISDPKSRYNFRVHCQNRQIQYADMHMPIPIKQFVDYGLQFQRIFAPSLEQELVQSIEDTPTGFLIQLANGERFTTKKVIVATGFVQFTYTPETLQNNNLVTHASEHSDLTSFNGKRVLVIGAGASAIDLAVLLSEAGAQTILATRRSEIPFLEPPGRRNALSQITAPMTGIGPGLRSWVYTSYPRAFHSLPSRARWYIARTHLGPAPAHFMRKRFERQPIDVHFSAHQVRVQLRDSRVSVTFDVEGQKKIITVDHVIAATGYKVDLSKLKFLDRLLPKIKTLHKTPVLNRSFESSVPGLHFAGFAATTSFGPIQRFVYGTDYTSRTIVRSLSK